MELHTPEYNEMMGKLTSGAMTRSEAAAAYDVKLSTIHSWITRANLSTPTTKRSVIPPAAAARSAALQANPDKVNALNEAVKRVMAGESTPYSEAKANPIIPLGTLQLWVRREREKLGQAPRPRGRPSPTNPADAVEAVRLARIALAKAEADLEAFLNAKD